jgi:hypothetical protein
MENIYLLAVTQREERLSERKKVRDYCRFCKLEGGGRGCGVEPNKTTGKNP